MDSERLDRNRELIGRDIRMGPFVVEAHEITTGSTTFREVVIRMIAEMLTEEYSEEFEHIACHVGTRFDHPKFFGINSACKSRYSFECDARSDAVRKRLSCEFYWVPAEGVARPRLQSRQIENDFQAYEIVQLIQSGATRLVCPTCGRLLTIGNSEICEEGVKVTCQSGCFDISFWTWLKPGRGSGDSGLDYQVRGS